MMRDQVVIEITCPKHNHLVRARMEACEPVAGNKYGDGELTLKVPCTACGERHEVTQTIVIE